MLEMLKQEIKDVFKNPSLYFDRSFSSGVKKQIAWLLAAFCLVLLILFGIYCLIPGNMEYEQKFAQVLFQLINPGEAESMPLAFALVVDFFGLIVLGGMLISVISNILERRVEAFQNGNTCYRMRNHIVIIGYNDSVPSLIQKIRTEDDSFILLQSGQDTATIRGILSMNLEESIEKSTLVVRGESNIKGDLRRLNIQDCKQVFIIGDNTLEAHDSVNLECAQIIAELWHECYQDLAKKLDCHVLFDYQTVYSVFQFSELPKEITEAIDFHPFNLEENWAKKVLVGSFNKSIYKPLEGSKGIGKDSKKHVHLIIVGMSKMGTALAVEAAQIAHFPNFKQDDHTTRTHITFIDNNAKPCMEEFMARFANVFDTMRHRFVDADSYVGPAYSLTADWYDPLQDKENPYHHLAPNFTDLQWEFINGSVESKRIRQYMIDATNDEGAITTIAICLPKTQIATQVAFYLPDFVLRNAHQILLYQPLSDAIVKTVNNKNDKCSKYDCLIPFGVKSDNFSNNKIGDEQGMWINAYYDFMYSNSNDSISKLWQEKNVDWARGVWNKTSVSNKWSSIHSANMLYTRLRSIGCTVFDDVEMIRQRMEQHKTEMVVTEHNRWVAEQLMAGFRPLNLEEWQVYDKQIQKAAKKIADKAHGNICSNEKLLQEEPESNEKDWLVILAILEILHTSKLQ